MMQLRNLLALIALAMLLMAGCLKPDGESSGGEKLSAGSTSASTPADESGQPAQSAAASEGQASADGLFPEQGPPKQIILMYTGDTLSQVTPRREPDHTEGGLSALAHAISDYQATIVDYNRRRVEDQGGDPMSIRADLNAGMLGEHPYLLLDYGGWERPNDYAGQVYVALYFRFFKDFHYSAIAGRVYNSLSDERWQAYRGLDFAPTLLVTAAEDVPGALDRVPVITRELHGQRWGITAPPVPNDPPEDGDLIGLYENLLDSVEGELAGQGCDFQILIMSLAPTTIYRAQAEESPFTVIIGSDPRTGVKPGYGDMPESGALLLPVLDPSGRQAAACHLYFEPDGDRPVMYNFTIIDCPEDETQPWPYRRLVDEASQQHYALVEEHRAAQE